MAACQQQRPKRAKYDEAWDLNATLRYLEQLPDNGDLDLPRLRQKTAFLLAVNLIARSSDLHRIRYSSIRFRDDLTIPNLLIDQPKNSRQTIATTLSPWPARPKLCVSRALQAYIQRTASAPRPNDKLFVSLLDDSELTSQRIAKDLLAVMSASGIDTSKYGAHSIRSAVTSRAIELGMSHDEIQRRGRWKSFSVLRDYYDRSHTASNLVAQLAPNGE